MAPILKVKPQGRLGRWIDPRFNLIMRHLLGAPEEGVQTTHRWNNHHLKDTDVAHLYPHWMVSHTGDRYARKIPRSFKSFTGAVAHMTRYGGWRRYIVIAPASHEGEWYVGWKWSDGAGVSRIPAFGAVRVLLGPGAVQWFGISAEDCTQIPVKEIGNGQIGDAGAFTGLPIR